MSLANKHAYSNALQLVGRLVHIYDIDITDSKFDAQERELLEQALRDYLFYARATDINGYKDVQSHDLEAGAKRKPGRPPKGN